MAEAEERLAQLLELANGLQAVGRALVAEEQQEQLIELARQLLAVIRALIDLLDERLARAAADRRSPSGRCDGSGRRGSGGRGSNGRGSNGR